MNISFERTGGFAGMRMMVTLDLESLPAQDAARLEQLLSEADFFNLTEAHPSHESSDRFQYTISVQAEGQQRTLHVRDGAIPDRLQPLLDDLSLRARSQRRLS